MDFFDAFEIIEDQIIENEEIDREMLRFVLDNLDRYGTVQFLLGESSGLSNFAEEMHKSAGEAFGKQNDEAAEKYRFVALLAENKARAKKEYHQEMKKKFLDRKFPSEGSD